jgi:FlaA1/EpsC-like NDP-sugar epimerase
VQTRGFIKKILKIYHGVSERIPMENMIFFVANMVKRAKLLFTPTENFDILSPIRRMIRFRNGRINLMKQFENKTVMVTGAGKNIGRTLGPCGILK